MCAVVTVKKSVNIMDNMRFEEHYSVSVKKIQQNHTKCTRRVLRPDRCACEKKKNPPCKTLNCPIKQAFRCINSTNTCTPHSVDFRSE